MALARFDTGLTTLRFAGGVKKPSAWSWLS